MTLGSAILGGICLILLALNGVYGLGFVPFLALWLGCWGALQWRSPDNSEKRDALLMLALTLAALLLVGLYFLGLRRPHNPSNSPSLGLILRIAVQFLAQGFGPACRMFWPKTGYLVLGLLLLSAGRLVTAVWRHRSRECLRALGLLLFLIEIAGLALAVGWGRSGGSPSYGLFAERYVALSALPLCCVYFIWEIYSPPAVGRLAQMILFTLICLAVPINTMVAREGGNSRIHALEAFEQDLRAGVPAPVLAQRYHQDEVISS